MLDATVWDGRVVHTNACSHQNAWQVWSGCSFCKDAQKEVDAYFRGEPSNYQAGTAKHPERCDRWRPDSAQAGQSCEFNAAERCIYHGGKVESKHEPDCSALRIRGQPPCDCKLERDA